MAKAVMKRLGVSVVLLYIRFLLCIATIFGSLGSRSTVSRDCYRSLVSQFISPALGLGLFAWGVCL